ncbi:hypothetical protein C8A05DRAFT_42508 [Staphylotrichum tortipilum]|uniref:MARVEL domain-containing protein n=1 Tax=Staphylotrichum tortipilum TaxID=2831512 RepID=A0AAN6MNX6_9PEZI|nr:hypothetical protein C8A05DRAFT_42508 [Staphylotrichum longicolle]
MWEDLEMDPERIPIFKLVFHSLQILLGFVSWCLNIAVFRADEAKIAGNGWTFGVFFLSVPAWIYLMMAPRFPRTRKLAQPHAMLVVDVLFTIIWLSAFAVQAAYNTSGLCGTACGISKGVVALAVFVFLFFCVTTFFSIWTLKYYQWNNRLPGYDRAQLGSQNIDPDKAAFSLAPHDEESYAPVNMNDHDHDDHDNDAATSHYGGAASTYGGGRSDYSDPYTNVGAGSTVGGGSTVSSAYQDNPFRRQERQDGANPFDSDTEYHSGSVGGRYGTQTAVSAGVAGAGEAYDDARFPHANYERIER